MSMDPSQFSLEVEPFTVSPKLLCVICFQSKIIGNRLREPAPSGRGKLRSEIRVPISNNLAHLRKFFMKGIMTSDDPRKIHTQTIKTLHGSSIVIIPFMKNLVRHLVPLRKSFMKGIMTNDDPCKVFIVGACIFHNCKGDLIPSEWR